MKKVAVGSKNKPKMEAVRAAFEKVWPEEAWEVVGVEVESGVGSQPMSDEEAITGARNRARQALQAENSDYGVGIEGGIHQTAGTHFAFGWMVIVDKNRKEGIGSSIRMRVPPRAIDIIQDGKELGDADDVLFGKSDSKHREGFFGLMSKNLITRSSGYTDGVIVALTRFIHPHLFE
ncbi:MAG: hypothetical protein A3B25_00095 [Candidatus Ryanbacteria bacterium RIFCSPLOWO2_01_FULL_48_26]|uniref:Probable inosine/xanthosine triphosphatase n=1 Tax=Candidatus Ryanbacteria bacterium RIFCSPLOWO2_01_FULL_48_26 TaxID=1802126 RepID=A0A1G2GT56_9BACT|nr:MAG: hypothetical protein A3B25_00095 [Candidatus Ryanbacteria bacterium RIFCSPLOWO2_01_FULL_48_26]